MSAGCSDAKGTLTDGRTRSDFVVYGRRNPNKICGKAVCDNAQPAPLLSISNIVKVLQYAPSGFYLNALHIEHHDKTKEGEPKFSF